MAAAVDPVSAPARTTTTVVVMGVSGSGKTTVAKSIAGRLGWPFAEGDDFHPMANIEKMRAGRPLTDDDRWPWLAAIAMWISLRERADENAVITCSALKRAYRDFLRQQHESVWFVHVSADADLIWDRLQRRKGHYMPPSLLDSQLATLEPLAPDEPGVTVSGTAPPEEVTTVVLGELEAWRAAERVRAEGGA